MDDRDYVSLSILLIDDDPGTLRAVGNYLEARGHSVRRCCDGVEGQDALAKQSVDLVITDVKMPKADGFEVLRTVRDRAPDTDVILMTAFGDVDHAVRAMREGAFDFFAKPVRMRDLSASLQRTVRFRTLKREHDRMKTYLDRVRAADRRRYGLATILGESEAIQRVRGLIEQVAFSPSTTVLIVGETGTGKELVARAVHDQSSGELAEPFVAVDCSAIPEALQESEFFGHGKGAFTGATEARPGLFLQANGGTLFLDEVVTMPGAMQPKLLRALEERRIRPVGKDTDIPVDVRVVAAANTDLCTCVKDGSFREDLYYRLNVFQISLPPLRERSEDIPLLASHFLRVFGNEMRKPAKHLSSEAEKHLKRHLFPGNVRELRNIMERAVISCTGETIEASDLWLTGAGGIDRNDLSDWVTRSTDLDLSTVERAMILEALHRSDGNLTRASGTLGISRDALRRKMRNYGIKPEL